MGQINGRPGTGMSPTKGEQAFESRTLWEAATREKPPGAYRICAVANNQVLKLWSGRDSSEHLLFLEDPGPILS